MRVLHQLHGIKDNPSNTEGSHNCVGCFPPIRVGGRGRRMPRKHPDQETRIVIPYNNVDEEFEATLRTYKSRQKDGSRYYRHFLIDVSESGPAGLMRIENFDEMLIMDDDDFVPNKSHDEVLDIFHNVKVDGKTRFSLVIRRRPKGKWVWIETSAILAPGSHPVCEDQPVVEDAEYKKLDNKYTEITTTNRYKIRGTQRFLDIKNRQVTADVASGRDNDNTKKICKRQRYWQGEDGQVYFEAALCDERREHYISFGSNNTVIVKNEPEWFEMKEIASDILFRTKNLYLGYNREQDQVDAQTSEFLFEEIPGDIELDIPRRQSLSSDIASLISLPESNSSLSLQNGASSEDDKLPNDQHVSKLSSCNVTAEDLHVKIAEHMNDTNSPLKYTSVNLNESGSSGYLSINLDNTEIHYGARSLHFDEMVEVKLHSRAKETTV